MKPIDPLSPLPQSSEKRTRGRWVYILLLALAGAGLVWLLLVRANTPEEGRVLEGRHDFVKAPSFVLRSAPTRPCPIPAGGPPGVTASSSRT